MPYPDGVHVLRRLAQADGAVGWSLMINTESPQLLALLPAETFAAIYAAGPDVTIAGTFAPRGEATPVAGGYRVSGRWGFASACEHSDWLFANCVVPGPGGVQGLRCMALPREAWQIHDTWHTLGLRGTGSQDIALVDAFVPQAQSFDLFGGVPCRTGPQFAGPLLQFSMHIGAVALGIGQGALADLIGHAQTGRTRLYGRTAMRDSELFRYRIGRAEADLRAAEALLDAQAAEFWARAQAGTVAPDLLPRVQQAVAWIVETAQAVVDACHKAGGSAGVYDGSALQRRLRDIHTLSQHASVQEALFASNGALLLGIDPGFTV
ncbi:acyl-CoA dehydrogenase family protein [Zavarzinia sp. CC-PAN008]|uniref:acyl-CoA dehydrogenase family protein n=1 Tax=Zavarzinia sp. CC-PAN008 TaxID=3243332 RepID=UPI003F748CA9